VSELPAHVTAEVQRILDGAARLALLEELDIDPALVPPASADRRLALLAAGA
jgi:hypothetical protein